MAPEHNVLTANAFAMPIYVLEPPLRYNHPYHGGPVIERVLSLSEAQAACAHMGVHADACSWSIAGRCHIVIPRGGPVKDLRAYRRHELAHCNGWTHGHGDAAVETEQPTPSMGVEGQR